MNRVKNNLLLGGAILAIIYGIVVAILVSNTGRGSSLTNAFNSRLTLFSIGTIIVGVLICVPKLRNNKYIIIAEIGFLIAIIINTVVYLQNRYVRVNGVELLMVFATLSIGVMFAGLIMPDKSDVAKITTSKEANVELLKKLKANGDITEEEYKTRLMKELDK